MRRLPDTIQSRLPLRPPPAHRRSGHRCPPPPPLLIPRPIKASHPCRIMAVPFAVFFTGKSFPIPGSSFTQADATHWVRGRAAREMHDSGPAACQTLAHTICASHCRC